jgi:hypothetical protein
MKRKASGVGRWASGFAARGWRKLCDQIKEPLTAKYAKERKGRERSAHIARCQLAVWGELRLGSIGARRSKESFDSATAARLRRSGFGQDDRELLS